MYEKHENPKLTKRILQHEIDSPTLQNKTVNDFHQQDKECLNGCEEELRA